MKSIHAAVCFCLSLLGRARLLPPFSSSTECKGLRSQVEPSLQQLKSAGTQGGQGGQEVYHWVEMRAKMRIMGFRGAAIKPLSEEAAADLGAELLGEAIVFGVGGLCIYLEYARQSTNSQRKEDELSSTLLSLQEQISELNLTVEALEARLREANRILVAVSSAPQKK